jgi:hypothetical protein
MSRFAVRPETRGTVSQRGLGPPAWRRTLGIAILILSAAAAGVITARLMP